MVVTWIRSKEILGNSREIYLHWFGWQVILEWIISSITVRAPVFGRHQFFGTSEYYWKAHGSLLSGWKNSLHCMLLVSYIQQYFNTSITILANQVWKLLIALLTVLNTGVLNLKVHVITEGSLSGSCKSTALMMTLQCTVQYIRRHTMYGQAESTGHAMRAEARWPITVRYFVRWPFWAALPFSGNKWRRSSRFTRIYVSWHLRSSRTDFSQTNFIS